MIAGCPSSEESGYISPQVALQQTRWSVWIMLKMSWLSWKSGARVRALGLKCSGVPTFRAGMTGLIASDCGFCSACGLQVQKVAGGMCTRVTMACRGKHCYP